MNARISLSQAVYGYSLAAEVRLSPETLESYYRYFDRLGEFMKMDPPISSITKDDILEFLNSLDVGAKTVKNYHAGLSSLWHWAVDEGFIKANVVLDVKVKKPKKPSIVPYSIHDVKAMLGSLKKSISQAKIEMT